MRRLTLGMAAVLTAPLVAVGVMASPVARAPAASAATLKPAAGAEYPNPLHAGEKPVLGWSSWSTFRHVANAAIDEAEARAMVSDGLAAEGYSSINEDDGWYTCYPVSYTQPTLINGVETMNYGPGVDQWGRWTTSQLDTSNTGAFPDDGSINGMQVLGNYLHRLGLKFGIYLTPGISGNALAETPRSRRTPTASCWARRAGTPPSRSRSASRPAFSQRSTPPPSPTPRTTTAAAPGS